MVVNKYFVTQDIKFCKICFDRQGRVWYNKRGFVELKLGAPTALS